MSSSVQNKYDKQLEQVCKSIQCISVMLKVSLYSLYRYYKRPMVNIINLIQTVNVYSYFLSYPEIVTLGHWVARISSCQKIECPILISHCTWTGEIFHV